MFKPLCRHLRPFRAFSRHQGGATIMEFALLLPPFVLMMSSILEVAVNTHHQGLLDRAVQTAGRLLLTGKVSSAQMSKEQFRAAICAATGQSLDCAQLRLSVRQAGASFYDEFEWSDTRATDDNDHDNDDDHDNGFGNDDHDDDDGGDQAPSRRYLRHKPGSLPAQRESYCIGQAGDVLIIEANYPTVSFVPLVSSGSIFGSTLYASTVVRNEPFDDGGANGAC